MGGHSRRAVGDKSVVDRVPDGTPLYAPRGVLPCELDASAVQCHLCERWYRNLASSHVRHAHGLTAAEYRLLAGLRTRHPLQTPVLSAARSDLLRDRIITDGRLQAGMAVGATLARAGEPQRLAEQALRQRPVALERQQQLADSGSRAGIVRAAAFRARREAQARSLGFTGLEGFYRRRYRDQRARLGGPCRRGPMRRERGARRPAPVRPRT